SGPAEPTAYDATMALRELALTKHALAGAARAEAENYLARPTDPPGPNNPDRSYGPVEETPACAGAVCVHYVASSNDAPVLTDDNANGRPDYVDLVLGTTVKVHNTYVAAGYRPPKSDGMRGTGPETDIYIQDIGGDGLYGYCTSDQNIPSNGPYDAWAYCVVDDDYAAHQFPTNTPRENLQVTVAHEYFHAVQFGYDIAEDSWFLEATAAWVEDEVYDAVNDNVQYLSQSPLRLPRVPMDTFGGSFHYGTWIFFRYLSERYPASQGGLPTVVRDMVRKTDGSKGAPDLYSMQAVKAVLKARGADLPKLFAKFANANRRPAKTYSEGRANNYRPSPLLKKLILGRGQSRGDTFSADHLTSGTVRFSPARALRARTTKLRLQVRMAPARRGSAAVAAIKLRSGKVRVVPVRIRANGSGAKALPFSARTVKYIELTLANAGTNYACFNGGPYSCQGTSKNDNVKETYRGTVRVG
ncbi:MAG: hypothetical protein M3237_23135, partial [Actinomycetota bacterium]|nr:hypothetical protein [Actinomycetota bacterium]